VKFEKSNYLIQGARHYSGLEEAMGRNIDACQQLSTMTKSALGPHGKYLENSKKVFPLFF